MEIHKNEIAAELEQTLYIIIIPYETLQGHFTPVKAKPYVSSITLASH